MCSIVHRMSVAPSPECTSQFCHPCAARRVYLTVPLSFPYLTQPWDCGPGPRCVSDSRHPAQRPAAGECGRLRPEPKTHEAGPRRAGGLLPRECRRRRQVCHVAAMLCSRTPCTAVTVPLSKLLSDLLRPSDVAFPLHPQQFTMFETGGHSQSLVSQLAYSSLQG